MKLLLLPGMDGTGVLFEPLLRALPPTLEPVVVDYPRDVALTYAQLLERIPVPAEPFVIVGESFSGPLAMRLAARAPSGLRGVVLVATFARRPRSVPRWLASLAASVAFRFEAPDGALRWALLGDDATSEELAHLKAAIRSVRPHVLAQRVREIFTVDAREALRVCPVPVLALVAAGDRLIPPEAAQEFSRLRPNLELHTLDGPHLLLQRRPTEAAKQLVQFARRLLLPAESVDAV